MTYRDEIAQMLRRMPSDWNRQYRSGRAQLGVALPDVPSPEQAMMLIGITAGGRESGDSPIGKNRVPRDVRDAAMKGLRLSYANNYGAWNFIGIARAIELALMPAVSDTTTSRMHNYLFRHQKDKAGKNFGNDTTPSRGYMAWLNWGGDPAVRWLGVPTMRQNPKRYSLVVRTPGFPELDVVKGTYSSLKEAQDAVTLGKLKLHRPWRKHGEEYQWSAAKNLWAVPDDAPRPTEWSYKVVQMPPTKYVGKHWRLEIAQKGMVVEVYKTDSRKSAEQMGDLILARKNRRKNPGVEIRQLGSLFFIFRDGAPTGKNAKTRAKAEALAATMTSSAPVVAPRPAPAPRVAAPAPRVAAAAFPGAVMLAKPYAGTDPTGWWMSEKLDGVRAYWTGTHFYTRNGNPINAPEWFTRGMPNVALDGELTAGRGAFQQTVSAVRKQKPVDAEWQDITFQVFDAPNVSGGCEARWAEMNRVVAGVPYVTALPQTRCSSPRHLAQVRAEIAALGGEGVMLREPGSVYEPRRTGALRKVKSFQDAEARITGYTAGTGKHAGRLGAYEAVLLKGSRAKFRIGTGISDAEREQPLPVGTVVTVKFQELTDDGVPRFPALVGPRDYE